MSFFNKILKFIANASIPTYKFEDNKLHFKVKSEELYEYELELYDMKTRHDPFVLEAYTLNSQNVFLEYIRTDANAQWHGQPLSVYEGFFKEKLNIKELKTLEKNEIDHYVFKTYKVDDSLILHMIYIYGSCLDIMIWDTKGDLYKQLLFRVDGNYEYNFDNETKGDVNFNISIVKENALRGYFDTGD